MPTTTPTLRLALVGGFSLEIADTPVVLPLHAQRVLAYLGVGAHDRSPCARTTLADRLWQESSQERAQASLRTALWRIRQADRALVAGGQDVLRLGKTVTVDLHESLGQAGRLLSDDPELRAGDVDVEPLTGDLLPGWEEDWLLLERERVRQLHLHALEALSHRLRRQGSYAQAVNAALAAVAAEPLRESAQTALIAAHLGEGNVVEAHRQLDRYAGLLWAELRLPPSPALVERLRRHERQREATEALIPVRVR